MSVWADMQEAGVVTAVGHFSGGHDEGGVDEVTLTLEDGGVRVVGWGNGEGADKRIFDVIEGVVHGEYGSFAGDFYVNGTVTLDLASKKATVDKSEEIPQDVKSSYDIALH